MVSCDCARVSHYACSVPRRGLARGRGNGGGLMQWARCSPIETSNCTLLTLSLSHAQFLLHPSLTVFPPFLHPLSLLLPLSPPTPLFPPHFTPSLPLSPWRIMEDCGAAFAMGCIGGGVFSFWKGYRNSPVVRFYMYTCTIKLVHRAQKRKTEGKGERKRNN